MRKKKGKNKLMANSSNSNNINNSNNGLGANKQSLLVDALNHKLIFKVDSNSKLMMLIFKSLLAGLAIKAHFPIYN